MIHTISALFPALWRLLTRYIYLVLVDAACWASPWHRLGLPTALILTCCSWIVRVYLRCLAGFCKTFENFKDLQCFWSRLNGIRRSSPRLERLQTIDIRENTESVKTPRKYVTPKHAQLQRTLSTPLHTHGDIENNSNECTFGKKESYQDRLTSARKNQD